MEKIMEEFRVGEGEEYFGIIGIKKIKNKKGRSSVWKVNPTKIPKLEEIDKSSFELEVLQRALHPNRVKILLLCMDRVGQKEIEESTGLKGGALYHHLKELQLLRLITKKEGKYEITQYGTFVLTVALLGMTILKEILSP